MSLLLLLLAPTGALADTPRVDRIDVTGYGTCTGTRTSIAVPGALLGIVSGLGDIKQSQKTRTIPAQSGVSFGFRYNVVGSPNGASVRLHTVVIYPSPGLVNPATKRASIRDEVDHDRSVGRSHYLGYSFEHDWELFPGKWTFQIMYQGRLLAEQSFNVVKQ